MAQLLKIVNLTKNNKSIQVENYSSFWLKFRGLMFRQVLSPGEGVIFIDQGVSRLNASIHMLFMNFEIAVFWVNKKKQIVDKVIARPWKPFYMPGSPACITIEAHPSHYGDFDIGDQIAIEPF